MNPAKMRPRALVAVIIGVGCAALLYLLLAKSDVRLLAPQKPDEPQVVIASGTVREGDHLAKILAREGVPDRLIPSINRSLGKAYDLERIMPGHAYEVISSTDNVFQKFVYRTNPIHSYTISATSAGVSAAEENEQATVWVERRIQGEVTEFLYKDLMKQGLDANFVGNLTNDLEENIFGWKVDFYTEQRPGDKYDILLEQEFLPGADRPIRGRRPRILVAAYYGSGTRNKENIAFRFQEPGSKRVEYYDSDGKAQRRAFLRAPFSGQAFRVSSGFNRKRFHPILRVHRPHHGTDYAAVTGTPVAAIGRGTVVRAGWYKGYGKCVDIRHTPKYTSRYGHLSRINVSVGKTVQQGQFIGRVGSTGMSTGPHLHFEMLVDGVQQNFLRMNFPSASSVAQANMPLFRQTRDALLARFQGAGEVAAGAVATAMVTNTTSETASR